MALKKTFKNQDGGTSNGYYRVREVGAQYEKDKDGAMDLGATFNVEVYDYDSGKRVNDLEIRREGEPAITWRPEGRGVYGLTLSDMEPVQTLIIKAYDHFKTLPEFDGATDC